MNPAIASSFALGGLGIVRLLGVARLRLYEEDVVGFCSYFAVVVGLVALLATLVVAPQIWSNLYTAVMSGYAGAR